MSGREAHNSNEACPTRISFGNAIREGEVGFFSYYAGFAVRVGCVPKLSQVGR